MSYKSPVQETVSDRAVIIARNGLGLPELEAQKILREHLRGSTQGPSRFQRMLAAPLPSYSLWDVYNAFPLGLRRGLGHEVVKIAEKRLKGNVGDLVRALTESLPRVIEVNTAPLQPVLRLSPGSNTYRNRRRNRLVPPQTPSPRRPHVSTLVIYLGLVLALSFRCHLTALTHDVLLSH